MGKFTVNKNITVKNCPRCKQEHWLLLFFPLTEKAGEFSYWATCPEYKEPVLLRVDKENESYA